MADGLDVMCETNREVKDNAKVYGFFDLSNWLKLWWGTIWGETFLKRWKRNWVQFRVE